uniref:Uncharacterized protein n=1 Tax=Rhizophora mucronata TaxID=61149 RepID=A0A2P2NI56_RHIMU
MDRSSEHSEIFNFLREERFCNPLLIS